MTHGRTTRWLTTTLVGVGAVASILIGAAPASAHDTTSEAITLTVTDQRILGTAPVLFTELGYDDTSGDGLIDAQELQAQESTVVTGLVNTVRGQVRIEIDGEEVVIIGAGPAPTSGGEDTASQYVDLLFATGPHDGAVSEVAIDWSFTSPSDQVLLSGAEESATGQLSNDGRATFSLDPIAAARSFFVTGLEHVSFGLDHLLFLVVLTFAVVGSTVSRFTTWRVVKLVTAFTIGHATSLVLAYFDIVSIPSQWVEPAISLSIVAAAVLAIRGRGDTIRPWIAAAIGLVHGLGFASSLSGLGLATTANVSALAAFNIGIDVAQTAVVLLVTGTIWAASRVLDERRDWLRVIVCSIAALVGLTWTASRLAF
ncbi:HupE/UreJ family protein [Nocardioides salsibiostraticola]